MKLSPSETLLSSFSAVVDSSGYHDTRCRCLEVLNQANSLAYTIHLSLGSVFLEKVENLISELRINPIFEKNANFRQEILVQEFDQLIPLLKTVSIEPMLQLCSEKSIKPFINAGTKLFHPDYELIKNLKPNDGEEISFLKRSPIVFGDWAVRDYKFLNPILFRQASLSAKIAYKILDELAMGIRELSALELGSASVYKTWSFEVSLAEVLTSINEKWFQLDEEDQLAWLKGEEINNPEKKYRRVRLAVGHQLTKI